MNTIRDLLLLCSMSKIEIPPTLFRKISGIPTKDRCVCYYLAREDSVVMLRREYCGHDHGDSEFIIEGEASLQKGSHQMLKDYVLSNYDLKKDIKTGVLSLISNAFIEEFLAS